MQIKAYYTYFIKKIDFHGINIVIVDTKLTVFVYIEILY